MSEKKNFKDLFEDTSVPEVEAKTIEEVDKNQKKKNFKVLEGAKDETKPSEMQILSSVLSRLVEKVETLENMIIQDESGKVLFEKMDNLHMPTINHEMIVESVVSKVHTVVQEELKTILENIQIPETDNTQVINRIDALEENFDEVLKAIRNIDISPNINVGLPDGHSVKKTVVRDNDGLITQVLETIEKPVVKRRKAKGE